MLVVQAAHRFPIPRKKLWKELGHTVTFAVVSPEKKVLFVFEPEQTDPKWKLPSESHKFGESQFQTLRRGIEEELGIKLSLERVQKNAIRLWNEGFRQDGSYRSIFFLLKLTQEEFESHSYYGDEDGRKLLIKEVPISTVREVEDRLDKQEEFFKFLKRVA